MVYSLLNKVREYKRGALEEFFEHIDILLESDAVKQLDDFRQHYCFSRLQHSIDVAYYSFFLSKLFGWDSKSAARAGLLHDMFLYDCHDDTYKVKSHLRLHPKIALENARGICELNEVEEDIIKKHMWLITMRPPRYKESYIVTFVDKYCALREIFISVTRKCGEKFDARNGFGSLKRA